MLRQFGSIAEVGCKENFDMALKFTAACRGVLAAAGFPAMHMNYDAEREGPSTTYDGRSPARPPKTCPESFLD